MNKKIGFAILALAVLIAGAAAFLATVPAQAKNSKNKKQAKIEWSQKSVQAQVNPGETIQTTVTFTPTAEIANAEFRITASLSDTVQVEPAAFESLTAGTPYQVTVTFTAPTENNRKKYHGVMALIDQHKLYAKPLKLRLGINK